MKHPYKPLILLILLASVMLFGTRSAPASNGVLAAAVPLPFQPQPHAPDHPAQVVAMVYGPPVNAVQQSASVRTFERTALERDVRRLHGQFVVADTWVSPREGHKVVWRQRVYHHLIVRVLF